MTSRAASLEADQHHHHQQQQQEKKPDAALTEKQIAAALQCDCVKELREGPCGEGFVQGILCTVATCGSVDKARIAALRAQLFPALDV